MLLSLLLKGTLIGLSIAMPVGPIGMLCIRNSLSWGTRYGFMTGMGAAAADTLYGALAGFGVAALTTLLISYQFVFQLVGGLFLCYLGLMTFRAKNVKDGLESAPSGMLRLFLTTFFLTLTNPMTILSFIGIYAGLGVGVEAHDLQAAFLLTSGVFLGSALWWLALSSGTALLKNRFNLAHSHWLNRLSGSILLGFGIAALFT